MEPAEAAAEAGVGNEAAPAPADERGADEPRGVLWREAEEHLLHELIRQRRRHGAFARSGCDANPAAPAGAKELGAAAGLRGRSFGLGLFQMGPTSECRWAPSGVVGPSTNRIEIGPLLLVY